MSLETTNTLNTLPELQATPTNNLPYQTLQHIRLKTNNYEECVVLYNNDIFRKSQIINKANKLKCPKCNKSGYKNLAK